MKCNWNELIGIMNGIIGETSLEVYLNRKISLCLQCIYIT